MYVITSAVVRKQYWATALFSQPIEACPAAKERTRDCIVTPKASQNQIPNYHELVVPDLKCILFLQFAKLPFSNSNFFVCYWQKNRK